MRWCYPSVSLLVPSFVSLSPVFFLMQLGIGKRSFSYRFRYCKNTCPARKSAAPWTISILPTPGIETLWCAFDIMLNCILVFVFVTAGLCGHDIFNETFQNSKQGHHECRSFCHFPLPTEMLEIKSNKFCKKIKCNKSMLRYFNISVS